MIVINAMMFFLKETFIGIRRSSLMTLIAVATIAITLIIQGVFMLISANLSNVTEKIASKLEVRIFLKENLKVEEIQVFKRNLKNIKGIKDVTFINSKDAWKDFRADYSHLKFGEHVNNNPLPNSLNLKLERAQDIRKIILYLKRYDTIIDDIVYGGELADRVQVFRRVMFIAGWSLILLLILSSLFIIVNTIRLTVIARSEEITIMRLVGATDQFIRCPFLIEGFVIGITGATISVSALYFIYSIIITKLIKEMPFFPFIQDSVSLYYIYGFVLISGSLIGMIGAYISVSKTLKGKL